MTNENIPFLPAQEQTEDRPAPLIDDAREMHNALTMAPETGPQLVRQAALMDDIMQKLLGKYMERYGQKEFGYYDSDLMNLILRLQKQCMNTLRTHAAINYMNALLPVTLSSVPFYPAPTSRKNDEQTCETKNTKEKKTLA